MADVPAKIVIIIMKLLIVKVLPNPAALRAAALAMTCRRGGSSARLLTTVGCFGYKSETNALGCKLCQILSIFFVRFFAACSWLFRG